MVLTSCAPSLAAAGSQFSTLAVRARLCSFSTAALLTSSRAANQSVYPFFRFASSEEDPYTFRLTFWASSIIWVSLLPLAAVVTASDSACPRLPQASELTSSLVTRTLCRAVFSVDIARLGWDIMR